jgi:Zn-dependent protease
MFNLKEVKALVISVIIMGIALGFNDKQDVFVWGYFLNNMAMMILMVAIAFVVHQLGHKLVAYLHGFSTEYKLWNLTQLRWWPLYKRWSPLRGNYFPKKIRILGKDFTIPGLPIGIIIAFFVTLFSNGYLFWLAVGKYDLLIERKSRLGKRFVEVTDFEEAKIALAGPLANVALMVFAALFNNLGTFDNFIMINGFMALFYLIPVSQLDGGKAFHCSRVLYLMTVLLVICMILLVKYISIIPLLVISLLLALIGGGVYFYFAYFKNQIV